MRRAYLELRKNGGGKREEEKGKREVRDVRCGIGVNQFDFLKVWDVVI